MTTWQPLPEKGRFAALYRRINQLGEIVESLKPATSIHGLTTHTALGWTVTPRPGGGTGDSKIEVKAFAIISEKADWLMCLPWLDSEPNVRVEGTTIDADHYIASELIRVAKPWVLRKAPFDGQTMNGQSYEYFDEGDALFSRRHVTVGAYHEIQVIVEPYRVNELIYAAKGITNGLHIIDEDFLQDPPEWQDLNVNAHAWGETFERITEDGSF